MYLPICISKTRPNSFVLKNKKNKLPISAGTINRFLQNKAEHQLFPMSEEKKTMLELKISGSGINEGSVNFEVLTNKGLKLRSKLLKNVLAGLTLFLLGGRKLPTVDVFKIA